LRLDFSARASESTLFAGRDRLKLVTHCNNRSRDADNVIDEYLAYRIFNTISALSYRVRLLRIHYVDTERIGDAALQRWGFLVESDEDLAARTGVTIADIAAIPYSRVNHEQAALMYVDALTRQPRSVGEADVAALRSAGWSDGQILEINQVAAYFAYANPTVTGLGVDTEGEVLGLAPEDSTDWHPL